MKKTRSLLTVLIIATVFSSTALGQDVMSQYAVGKIYHSNGFVLEGKNIRMSMESVTFEVMGQDQTLPLFEVSQVMVKKGKGRRFGKMCGIISLSLSGLTYLTSGGKTENEAGDEVDWEFKDFITGTVLLGGLSYGVGYGAGLMNDPWEVVYLKRN